jgi:hypothetical protein
MLSCEGPAAGPRERSCSDMNDALLSDSLTALSNLLFLQ